MRRAFTQLYCHLVWATWDRLPLISGEIEPRLFGAIETKLVELGCLPIAVGCVSDHVHCLCRFSPTVSIATLVQKLKGSSSHLINHEVRPEFGFQWQGSYGAFTVRKDEVPAVKAYVRGQKRHHDAGTVWADWEQTSIEMVSE